VAKEKIRQEFLKQIALESAKKKALDFAGPLFDMDAAQADNFKAFTATNQVAQELKLVVKATPPFDTTEPPAGLKVRCDFIQTAFALSTNSPFGGPVEGEDAVYVLAYKKQIPSEIPPLAEIKAKVVFDYRYTRAIMLARKAGEAFYYSAT